MEDLTEDHFDCRVKIDGKRARAELRKTLNMSTTQAWHDGLDQGNSSRMAISVRFC